MKRTVFSIVTIAAFSTAVHAADVTPAPMMDWKGLYIGAFAGGGWGNSNIQGERNFGHGENSDAGPSLDLDVDVDGFLGGLQAGYDYQYDILLIGIFGDFALSGLSGNVKKSHSEDGIDEVVILSEEGKGGPPAAFDIDYSWIATLRARAGFLPTENWLIYVTGGVAWAGLDFQSTVNEGPLEGLSNDDTDMGYSLGGGTKFRFNEKWSVFAEALYMDFGDNDLSPDFGPWDKINYDNDIWTIKGGINFRLD